MAIIFFRKVCQFYNNFFHYDSLSVGYAFISCSHISTLFFTFLVKKATIRM